VRPPNDASGRGVVGQWISSGFWRYARHPNYGGEIFLWTGIFIVASSVLSGMYSNTLSYLIDILGVFFPDQYNTIFIIGTDVLLALISPVFVAALLIGVSGVPIHTREAYKSWGHLPEWHQYVRTTNLLLPLPVHRAALAHTRSRAPLDTDVAAAEKIVARRAAKAAASSNDKTN
jgi:steroid 5-alpha reductase family enzyme